MRTVVENISVSETIDDAQALYPRLEEAYMALKWWLSRIPESGEIIDDSNWLYVQRGDRAVRVPALVVVYTFDACELLIKHLRVMEP